MSRTEAAAWKDIIPLPKDLAFKGCDLKLFAWVKDRRNQITKLFCFCFLVLMGPAYFIKDCAVRSGSTGIYLPSSSELISVSGHEVRQLRCPVHGYIIPEPATVVISHSPELF